MVFSDRPRLPISVRGSRSGTRRFRCPAAISPAVASMSTSGRRLARTTTTMASARMHTTIRPMISTVAARPPIVALMLPRSAPDDQGAVTCSTAGAGLHLVGDGLSDHPPGVRAGLGRDRRELALVRDGPQLAGGHSRDRLRFAVSRVGDARLRIRRFERDSWLLNPGVHVEERVHRVGLAGLNGSLPGDQLAVDGVLPPAEALSLRAEQTIQGYRAGAELGQRGGDGDQHGVVLIAVDGKPRPLSGDAPG